MKNLLTPVIVVGLILLAACSGDEPAPADMRISMTRHGSHDRFAGIPVYLTVLKTQTGVQPKGKVHWNFGDGIESDEMTPAHTYAQGGEYVVSVEIKLKDGGSVTVHDTFTVLPGLKTFGPGHLADNGLSVLQTSTGDYAVLTGPDGNLPSAEMHLYTTTENFALTGLQEINPGSALRSIATAAERFGMIAASGTKFIVYDKTGTKVADKSLPAAVNYQKVMAAGNGFYLVGDSINKEYANVNLRDAAGESVWYKSVATTFEGNHYVRGFKAPGTFIRYAILPPDELGNTRLALILHSKASGLLQFELPLISIYEIITLNDGFIVFGQQDGSELRDVFFRIDYTGTVTWMYAGMETPQAGSLLKFSGVSAFEADGFTYLFTRNMRGMKISDQGEIIWQKYFTLPNDIFKSAMINNAGNFVLLGNHHPSLTGFGDLDTSLYDLMLLEVNTDGEIVQ